MRLALTRSPPPGNRPRTAPTRGGREAVPRAGRDLQTTRGWCDVNPECFYAHVCDSPHQHLPTQFLHVFKPVFSFVTKPFRGVGVWGDPCPLLVPQVCSQVRSVTCTETPQAAGQRCGLTSLPTSAPPLQPAPVPGGRAFPVSSAPSSSHAPGAQQTWVTSCGPRTLLPALSGTPNARPVPPQARPGQTRPLLLGLGGPSSSRALLQRSGGVHLVTLGFTLQPSYLYVSHTGLQRGIFAWFLF